MTWAAVAGSTLMLRSGPGINEHLHFILNDPMDFSGYPPQSCMTVWATHIKRETGFDQSCVLDPGCHSFICDPSYVPFAMTAIYQAVDLEKRVAAKVLRTHDSVSPQFVRRLVACAIDSPRTPRGYKLIARRIWDALPAVNPPN